MLVGSDSSLLIDESVKLYIDEYDNICNINSDLDSDHNIVVSKDAITIEAIPNTTNSVLYNFNYKVTLSNDNLFDLFTGTMKQITLNCNTVSTVKEKICGIYYDPELLYDYELKKLQSYCSTCLDDHQIQTIVLITFKTQLMEQAIKTLNNEDALVAYSDLMRILDVSSIKKTNCFNRKCSNGICSICK